jgi:hypothetical protein
MPICRLLENHVFGPDEITVLTSAFEDTLRTLRLVDRADPATEIIANLNRTISGVSACRINRVLPRLLQSATATLEP